MSAASEPASATRYVLTALYSLAAFAEGLVIGSLGPSIVQLAAQAHSTPSTVAALYVFHGLGSMGGCFGGGFAYRLDVHPHVIFGLSLGLLGLSLLLPIFLFTVPAIFAAAFLNGIGNGMVNLGFQQLTVWVWGDDERVAGFMQMGHAGFALGATVSPGISALLGRFQPTFVILCIVCCILGVWSVLSPHLVFVRDPLVLKDMVSFSQLGETRAQIAVALFTGLLLVFYVAAEVTTGGLLHEFAFLSGLLSDSSAKLLVSLYWGSLAAGRVIATPVLIKVVSGSGPGSGLAARILQCNFAGAIGFSSVLFVFLAMAGVRSAAILVIGTIGLGLSFSTLYPVAFLIPLRFGMEIRVQMTSLFTFGDGVGEMLGAAIVARLMAWTSSRALFVGIFVWVALCTVFYVLALRAGKVVAAEKAASLHAISEGLTDSRMANDEGDEDALLACDENRCGASLHSDEGDAL